MPYLALGLTGPHLVALAGDPALTARWDALPLGFTVLGVDRVDGTDPTQVTLDASAVAASLAGRTTGGRFLVAAAPQRDHPYNLARRIVSLGHLSRGRSGVLVGSGDRWAPVHDAEDAGAWGGAGLGGGAPLTGATGLDAARAVRALEQSWPFASVLGDRETGILVQSDQITHIDLEGAWSIAGPLNAPEPPTGPSVVGWYAGPQPADVRVDADPVDLTIGDHGSVRPVGSGGEVPFADETDATGVLLRGDAAQPLADLLDQAEHLLGTGGYAPVPPGSPLRAALELPPAAAPPVRRSAFPVPQPHPSL